MLQPGSLLQARYAIDALIGSGGMGRVYLARQTMLRGRRLAVKEVDFDAVPSSERGAALEAFKHEAEILASLSHPNLVDVKDCFEEDGKIYLVMDFVSGQTLEERVRQDGPLPVATVLEYARQLCTVLNYLHTCEPAIIFRDLKPANVMLDDKGVLRLVDFGLAHVVDGSPRRACSEGTPGYAPVEQLMSTTQPCDARSDIYGLGATLYHLLLGKAPADVCSRLVGESIASPAEMRPDVPQWLSDSIMTMLEMRPDDRFQSAQEVRTLVDRGRTSAPSIQNDFKGAAFLRDMLGRRYPVILQGFDNNRVRFTCTLPRLLVQPKELYLAVPGYDEPLPVAFQVVELKIDKDVHTFEVHLVNPTLAVYRVLRDSLNPSVRSSWRVSYRGTQSAWVLNLESEAQVADLSRTGCRLITAEPLPLGRRLSLRLTLNDSIELTAQVCWSRTRRDGAYESGLLLVDLDCHAQDTLELYLDQSHTSVRLTA